MLALRQKGLAVMDVISTDIQSLVTATASNRNCYTPQPLTARNV
jgi:hypothetical protein